MLSEGQFCVVSIGIEQGPILIIFSHIKFKIAVNDDNHFIATSTENQTAIW